MNHYRLINGSGGALYIEHGDKTYGKYQVPLVNAASQWDREYIAGLRPPRYPLPAIPLTVEYWHDTVGIFAWDGERDWIVRSFVKR